MCSCNLKLNYSLWFIWVTLYKPYWLHIGFFAILPVVSDKLKHLTVHKRWKNWRLFFLQTSCSCEFLTNSTPTIQHFFMRSTPVGIQRRTNVVLTSMQRCSDVVWRLEHSRVTFVFLNNYQISKRKNEKRIFTFFLGYRFHGSHQHLVSGSQNCSNEMLNFLPGFTKDARILFGWLAFLIRKVSLPRWDRFVERRSKSVPKTVLWDLFLLYCEQRTISLQKRFKK